MSKQSQGLDFSSLPAMDEIGPILSSLESYAARDGTRLHYRIYEAPDSHVWLILNHGSAADSVYLYSLANRISRSGAANVVTPDLRGHGPSPAVRGDIDYIDQLEDDLSDLVAHLRKRSGRDGIFIVGGHSSGGGLALRFAGGDYGGDVAGYLFLAPYLGHAAPTTRPHSGGWARPSLWRIVSIGLANALGIRWLNGIDTLYFNLPPGYRTGRETRAYSYRLMTGFAPRDYATDLAAINEPALLLVGTQDEAFFPVRYPRAVSAHNEGVSVALIDGASHLGLVMCKETADRVAEWLAQF